MSSPSTPPAQIPVSLPSNLNLPSLTDLLLELRLSIWSHLLDLNATPRSYGYTGLPARAMPSPPPSFPIPEYPITQLPAINEEMQIFHMQLQLLEQQCRCRMDRARREHGHIQEKRHQEDEEEEESKPAVKATRTHSMVTVSKQLGAEYRQVYYERTNFFFLINEANVLRGIPHLHLTGGVQQPPATTQLLSNPPPPPPPGRIPNFWPGAAPSELFRNLRTCTLYIDLHAIETFLNPSKSSSPPAFTTVTSTSTCSSTDGVFDTRLTDAIRTLIQHMHQLQTIQLVFETRLADRIPLSVMEDRMLRRSLAHLPHPPPTSPRISLKRPLETAFWEEEDGEGLDMGKKEAADERTVREYNWDMFVGKFVDVLRGMKRVRGWVVRVGDKQGDLEGRGGVLVEKKNGEERGKEGRKERMMGW